MYCLFASFTCPLLRVKHLPTSHFDFDRNPLKAAASIYLQCLQQFKVLVCRVVEETCTDLSTCANSAAPTVTPCGLRILPSASSSSTWKHLHKQIPKLRGRMDSESLALATSISLLKCSPQCGHATNSACWVLCWRAAVAPCLSHGP